MKAYGLIADLHLHNWSSFASVDTDGVNSRLRLLLNDIFRCASEVRAAGGNTLVVAGDVFHVRGSIAPSVLNPTLDCFSQIVKSGMTVIVLAGNHDLEGKEATRLGSAITALEGVGCKVINDLARGLREMERLILIPWTPAIKDLKEMIESARAVDPDPSQVDLILHAPIDGVIKGLPDHGLSPEWLASQGFRSVYSGHYHNHKSFDGNVHSIGALAHHTWSDVTSKAGFLVVSDTGPKWFKSHAPEFVEVTAETDADDIALMVDGNYVRAKINSTKQKDVEELRAYLTDNGAKGVVILAQKEGGVAPRAGATVKAGESLEVSVADFIKGQGYSNPAALAVLCQEILTETRSAA